MAYEPDCNPAYRNRNFSPELYSGQQKLNTSIVLQADAASSSEERSTATNGNVGSLNIRGSADIEGVACQGRLRRTNCGSKSYSADFEWIASSLERQRAGPLADPDDKRTLGDNGANETGIR